ncbi:phosphotransferase [Nocardioides gansuensis]|uniref:Phosphotransferase n=1 Tax=Nocardioides gansuensis TaxID=2138300 RepID=A0A2T8FB77_9ACTN|nr:phosphotransferase [Nocardioides gansuensis]PVG82962.1 phosphotransferase [Nocardioides gansuensis]
MWQPEPGWRRLPGAGPSTAGVWVATEGGREVVVKRLLRPEPHEVAGLHDPRDVNYWRRAADVALSGVVAHSPGLREAPVVRVEEDDDGVTVVHAWVPEAETTGLFLATCLGRFAAADLGTQPWLARGQLRSRLALVDRRGGWRTLSRTPAADIADHLWRVRDLWLERCDALPQVPQHGDLVAANVRGRDGDDAVAIDWAHLGTGPVGADVGYLSLSTREGFEPLLDAYLSALPPGLGTAEEAALGARVTAVYTALTRADWALALVAEGEGALAGKFKHPSVAPYLRALQAQVTQIEALLG